MPEFFHAMEVQQNKNKKKSTADKRKRWWFAHRLAHQSQPKRGESRPSETLPPETPVDLTEVFRNCAESSKAVFESISSMNIAGFPSVIDEARKLENVDAQEPIIRACLQRILYCMKPSSEPCFPHYEQIRTLRRLIFNKGDTLLIAKTGFGKSLIFHAFSILTGKITIQIIPLMKLGDEQEDDIRRLPGTNPCAITHETRAIDDKLIERAANGEFTHILFGPEQATTKEFRKALKRPEFQARIGLVAIDECHLVKQWKEFRPAFTMLGELRMILHRDVMWFACSATLSDEAKKLVLNDSGFRPVGDAQYQTEIIRTSIDRSDIGIGMFPIPRGKLESYESLYFLLDTSTDDCGVARPQQIPKTVIFIDGRKKVQKAAAYLQSMLVAKTKDGNGDRYSADPNSGALSVRSVVDIFTSRVAKYDRNRLYTEFKKPDSATRIIVATTSLGMGVNVPDIERVVLWKFPIGNDPADHW